MTTTDVELTDEQRVALDYCTTGNKQVMRLGGYAGTGKSTVVTEMVQSLRGYAVCAFTGKAANVLRRKGIKDARTIHSLIYRPQKNPITHQTEWVKIEQHELGVDGFIVDEASMVSAEIYRDLKSFGLPMVFVGDHGQLEPVGSAESGFCLMRDPDVTLEHIHRNAGEIARFAEHLRLGRESAEWVGRGGDQVSVIRGDQLAGENTDSADQIICAFNKTRCMLNDTVRDHLGLPERVPVVSDRVICLQNDSEHGVFNGMQGKLTKIDTVKHYLSFDDEDGREYTGIKYNPTAFGADKTPKRMFGIVPFDWSYCVTCHKMQGSEAENVLVFEQRCDLWEHRRWAYTAASRARRKLTWVMG